MLHHNANATQGYMRPDTHIGRPVAREEREDRGDMEAQAGDSMPKRRCWMEIGYKGALSAAGILALTLWATSRSTRISRQLNWLAETEAGMTMEGDDCCFDVEYNPETSYSRYDGVAGEEPEVLDMTGATVGVSTMMTGSIMRMVKSKQIVAGVRKRVFAKRNLWK